MRDKKKKTNKTITLTPEQRLIIENSLRVVQQELAEELAKTQSKILHKIVNAHYQDAKVYDLLTNGTWIGRKLYWVIQRTTSSVSISALSSEPSRTSEAEKSGLLPWRSKRSHRKATEQPCKTSSRGICTKRVGGRRSN